MNGAGLQWNQRTIDVAYNAWWVFYSNLLKKDIVDNQVDLWSRVYDIKYGGVWADPHLYKQRRVGYYGWIEIIEQGPPSSRRQLDWASSVDFKMGLVNVEDYQQFNTELTNLANVFTSIIIFECKTPVPVLNEYEHTQAMRIII